MHIIRRLVLAIALGCFTAGVATAQQDQARPLGIALEGFNYPYPVQFRDLKLHGKDVRMAYMDILPKGAAAGGAAPHTVVLFHGKNFFGAYWENTIRALTSAGFRVVVPDQIGFGKSTKPKIPYSFHDMAANTRDLLDQLGVKTVSVVGHSMGGMLATRFALMYPDFTSKLVLENPIGLEDYRTTVPYARVEDYYQEALKTTLEGTRKYHQTYYTSWKPEYDLWVKAQYGMGLGGEAPRLAMVNALTTQMIYEQPVVHQFGELRVPALLVIGQEDRTTLGRNKLSADQLKQMGQYPELGRRTAEAIPDAELVELENVGHTPHIEAPERFHEVLIPFLRK